MMRLSSITRPNRGLAAVAMLLLLAAAGCSKKADEAAAPAATETAPAPAATAPSPAPGVAVAGVTLGKAVGADKKVTQPTESFGKRDTIYASVATTGSSPSSKLTARWSYEDTQGSKPVKEDTQAIVTTGDAATEFHISKPDGWPAGSYKLEVLLDGNPVATKTFTVVG